MFIRFDGMYERDGRTDGQTPHDGMPRLHSIARQKSISYHRIIINYYKNCIVQVRKLKILEKKT